MIYKIKLIIHFIPFSQLLYYTFLKMDPEAFLDIANQVTKLKMFPYFDIAHSVLCALAVREDLGPGNLK